jgi:site-specific DNA-methyltransferase (adenine-specific)
MPYALENIDSLIYMKSLDACSIDCCITDPPYGIEHFCGEFDQAKMDETASSGGMFAGAKRGGMAWRSDQSSELREFLKPFFTEIYRILKPGAFFICFSQGRLLGGTHMALLDTGFEIREQFYWKKPSAKPNQQEPKPKSCAYDDRKVLGPGKVIEPFVVAQVPKEETFAKNWLKWGVGLVDKNEATTTMFEYAFEKDKSGCTHPTMKPVALMSRIVRAFTKPLDVVFDPFAGSGSTGVACLKHNRKFVGCELNKNFYEEAMLRLAKENV